MKVCVNADGTVKQTIRGDYKVPPHVRKLPDEFRKIGTMHRGYMPLEALESLQSILPSECWRAYRKVSKELLQKESNPHAWDERARDLFYGAASGSCLLLNEVRIHQADMEMLAYQIIDNSKDDKVKKMAALLLGPKSYRFGSAQKAAEWKQKGTVAVEEVPKPKKK